MEQQKSITAGVCRKCDKPRFHGALCREHENERQKQRRDAKRTKTCGCGVKITEDAVSCRKCQLARTNAGTLHTTAAPRVFAGRWEEWAAMREDVCPKRAAHVEAVERGRG